MIECDVADLVSLLRLVISECRMAGSLGYQSPYPRRLLYSLYLGGYVCLGGQKIVCSLLRDHMP